MKPIRHILPGFVAYSAEEQEIFHGRDVETAKIVDMIKKRNAVLLYGDISVGKTSLVKAALLPVLIKMGYGGLYYSLDYSKITSLFKFLQKDSGQNDFNKFVEKESEGRNYFKWEKVSKKDAQRILVLDDFENVIKYDHNVDQLLNYFSKWLKTQRQFSKILLISDDKPEIYSIKSNLFTKFSTFHLKIPSEFTMKSITDKFVDSLAIKFPSIKLDEFVSKIMKTPYPMIAWQYYCSKIIEFKWDDIQFLSFYQSKSLASLVNDDMEQIWEKLNVLEKEALNLTIKSLFRINASGELIPLRKSITQIKRSLNRQSFAVDKMLDLFFSGGINLFVFTEDRKTKEISLELANPVVCDLWQRCKQWINDISDIYSNYYKLLRFYKHHHCLPPPPKGHKCWELWMKQVVPSIKWREENLPLLDKLFLNSSANENGLVKKQTLVNSMILFLMISSSGWFVFLSYHQSKPFLNYFSTIKLIPDYLKKNVNSELNRFNNSIMDSILKANGQLPRIIDNDSSTNAMYLSPLAVNNTEHIALKKYSSIRNYDSLNNISHLKKEMIKDSPDFIQNQKMNILVQNAEKAVSNNDLLYASYLYLELYNTCTDEKVKAAAEIAIQNINKNMYLSGYFQPKDKIVDFDFSPYKNKIFTVEKNNIINLRDGHKGNNINEKMTVDNPIWKIINSSTGTRYALLCDGKEIPLIFSHGSKISKKSIHNPSVVSGIQFSRDGKMILFWDLANKLRLHYSITGLEKYRPVNISKGIVEAKFSKDEKYIICKTTYGETRVFELKKSSLSEIIIKPIEGLKKGAGIQFLDNDDVICWNSEGVFRSSRDKIFKFEKIFGEHFAPIQSVKCLAKIKRLLIIDGFKFIHLIDIDRPNNQPLTFQFHATAKDAFICSLNRILIIGENDWIEIRDIRSNEIINQWDFSSEQLLDYFVWPESGKAVFATRAGSIYFFDLTTGKLANTILRHAPEITKVKLSLDRGKLMTYSEIANTIKIWEFGNFYQAISKPENLSDLSLDKLFKIQTGINLSSDGKFFTMQPLQWQKMANCLF